MGRTSSLSNGVLMSLRRPMTSAPLRMFMTEPEAVRRPSDEAAPGARGVRPLTSTGQHAGPDQLCGYVAELRIGSLGGVGEDGECLFLFDLVPLHQNAFGLFNKRTGHHRRAQLGEIRAGPGCCFSVADRDRDPGSNLFG